eukprot:Skav231192  [mRNA]  locus=scaffold425:216298:216894:+ [translate_table: standard]
MAPISVPQAEVQGRPTSRLHDWVRLIGAFGLMQARKLDDIDIRDIPPVCLRDQTKCSLQPGTAMQPGRRILSRWSPCMDTQHGNTSVHMDSADVEILHAAFSKEAHIKTFKRKLVQCPADQRAQCKSMELYCNYPRQWHEVFTTEVGIAVDATWKQGWCAHPANAAGSCRQCSLQCGRSGSAKPIAPRNLVPMRREAP